MSQGLNKNPSLGLDRGHRPAPTHTEGHTPVYICLILLEPVAYLSLCHLISNTQTTVYWNTWKTGIQLDIYIPIQTLEPISSFSLHFQELFPIAHMQLKLLHNTFWVQADLPMKLSFNIFMLQAFRTTTELLMIDNIPMYTGNCTYQSICSVSVHTNIFYQATMKLYFLQKREL